MNVNWNDIETYISEIDNPKGNILFLHGFTGNFNNKISFRYFFNEYNFYGINMPGHGNSKFLSLNELNQNYYVDLVVEFIKKNNLNNLIILGHSMGGGIALLVYKKIKERITKLILEGPANKAVFENYEMSKKLMPETYEDTKFIMSKLFYDPIKFFGTKEKFELYCLNEFNSLNTKYKDLKTLLNKELMQQFFDNIQEAMKEIKIPTLLVIGKHDEIVPYKATVNNFVENVSGNYLSLVECDNCSHLPLTENREILPLIKQFIEK